jgi:hypothetical protein
MKGVDIWGETQRRDSVRTAGAPPSASTTDGGANARGRLHLREQQCRGASICEHNRQRLRGLCLQRQQSSPTEFLMRKMAQEAVNILWETQEGYNGGSQHREERSWWAQGPGCFERIGEWEHWIQQDHSLP